MYQYPKFSMSRGTLVVDENSLAIINSLRDRNFVVESPPPKTKDPEIKKNFLEQRIFVTNNDRDFQDWKNTKGDYSVIFIEQALLADRQAAADAISRAWIKHKVKSLHQRKKRFCLRIVRDSRTHAIQSNIEVR